MPKTHGLSFINGKRSPLHMAWMNMRNRCNNPNDARFKHYGARGITICDRWSDFPTFAQDLGPHPGPGYTLDRIETDGNYEPGNVRWATRAVQARNQRRAKLTKETAERVRSMSRSGMTQLAIAKIIGCDRSMIGYIVRGDHWR
jgi:hypothetical protein